MGKRKLGLTRSQWIGIIWVSVSLTLIMAIGFFSSARTETPDGNDTTEVRYNKKSTNYRDSSYRNYNNRRHNRNIRGKQANAYPPYDSTMYSTGPAPVRRQPLVVELNSADTLTLQLLNGIGPAYARRIVRYRDRIGGFTSTAQLLDVYGFTPELLDYISPYLTLDTTNIRLIDINTIELKQLIKHPYIEYYQARDIIKLRGRGMVFRNADDLRAVPSMSDSTLERLLPYISFDGSPKQAESSPTAQ